MRRLQMCTEAGRFGRVLEIMVLLAVAYSALGDTTQALDVLRKTLRLGEPEVCVRPFLEGGAAIERLFLLERAARTSGRSLSFSAAQPSANSYVEVLLAAFQSRQAGREVHDLTERELDVLRLLAVGAADKEIARILNVALGTVKRHTNSVYMKLSVHSRTQALTRARALGLVEG